MAVDLQPSKAMAEEAERGLNWREEFNRGGTEIGVARARDIKNRKNLSAETVGRMNSFFARHEVNKEAEGFRPGEQGYPSAGRIAWALWGGDPGQAWAKRKAEQLDNETNNMAAKHSWYAITKTDDAGTLQEVEISIYDEIGFGGVTAKDFLAEVKTYKGQHIHLRINSVGGSVVEGAAIYNSLRRHKGGLTVHVDGLAASMASVIAMAGEEVFIADNALMMVHNPWSMTMGDAGELRKEASVLDKLKNTLVNAYTRKTGLDAETIGAMMDEETWIDATEAVAMGFADEIEDGIEAAASVTPASARARFDNFTNSMARKSKIKTVTETIPVDTVPVAMNAEPQIVAADEDYEDPATEPMSQDEKIETLEAEVARLTAEALDKDAEIDALKADIARLGEDTEEKETEMAALRAASKSAGQQAAAIVASVGLDASAVVVAEIEPTAAEKFAALDGDAATEFYRANKRQIFSTLVL